MRYTDSTYKKKRKKNSISTRLIPDTYVELHMQYLVQMGIEDLKLSESNQ